jgi:sugar phosphate isomerase/epimerase
MKFGFSTYFFTKKNALQMMEDALSRGIRVFELSQEIPQVLKMDDAFFRELKNLRDQGVEFSTHAPFFEINLGSFFEDIRSISKRKIMDAIEIAGRIGAGPVVVHPGYTFLIDKVKEVGERTRDNFIEDLGEVSGLASRYGVKIGLENVHMPYFFFYNLDEFPKIKEAVPDIGITLDVGHAYVTYRAKGSSDPEGEILTNLERIGIENLFHVHLHNNAGLKDDHMFLRGHIDLKRIVEGLEKLGYREKVIVESYDMEQFGMDAVMEKLEDLTSRV